MNRTTWIKRALALIAAAFGIATIIAGARVLGGSDPGYAVFRPLLIFNTAMGAAYVVAGAMALRSSRQGMYAAGVIFTLNCLALGAIGYLYTTGNAIAIESIRAMIFRTAVWFALLLGFVWVRRGDNPIGR